MRGCGGSKTEAEFKNSICDMIRNGVFRWCIQFFSFVSCYLFENHRGLCVLSESGLRNL